MPMGGGGNLIHSQLLTLHVISLITVVWKVLLLFILEVTAVRLLPFCLI